MTALKELGRGAQSAKGVTRIFQNITDTWITLSNGLTVTPGHHFLDAFGKFRTIEDILRTDSQIVLADGTITTVTGEYIDYSEATAQLYEQAEGYVSATVGNLGAGAGLQEGLEDLQFRGRGLPPTLRVAFACITPRYSPHRAVTWILVFIPVNLATRCGSTKTG